MSNGTCPCCGAAVASEQFLVDLASNTVMRNGIVVKLPPQQAEILFVLRKHQPEGASFERIAAALWGKGDWPDSAVNGIHVRTTMLRKMIAPLGLSIEGVRGWGFRLKVDGEGRL